MQPFAQVKPRVPRNVRNFADRDAALGVQDRWEGSSTWLDIRGPNFAFTYGTGNPEPVRLYLATIGSGDTAHVFTVSIDTPDADTFATFAPVAQGTIDSIRFPATLPAARP